MTTVFDVNGVSGAEPGVASREPVFRDVPFDQSEWAGLYTVLLRVNPLKAELMRAQYESARTAYQNYLRARQEELEAYALRRQEDEAHNREVDAQRQQLLSEIAAIRARWGDEIDQLRRELKEAEVEARRRAARAGINLRGEPFLGIGLPETAELFPGGSTPAETEGAAPAGAPNFPSAHAPEQAASDASQSPPPGLPEQAAETIEPLTPEEAAHAAQLPTSHLQVVPAWFHWAAPALLGLAIGQLVLAAAGRPLGEWTTLPFWLTTLAGVLLALGWYRAVWGASRAVSELYYLFDWGAAKARRAAWLGGVLILALLLLPAALLLMMLAYLPEVGQSDSQLLAMLALIVLVPLLGLALIGGYFQGREPVVRNAIASAVVAARREQHQAAQNALRPEDEPQEPRPKPTPPEENAPKQPSPDASHSSVEGTMSSSAADEPLSPEQQSLLQEAYEAIGIARGIWQSFNRAQAMMQAEIAPYEQLLRELQRRPIYSNLPPWAEQRLEGLYQQWCSAYAAFLDYIAEAARECKDSEQIEQRIAAFKQRLGC